MYLNIITLKIIPRLYLPGVPSRQLPWQHLLERWAWNCVSQQQGAVGLSEMSWGVWGETSFSVLSGTLCHLYTTSLYWSVRLVFLVSLHICISCWNLFAAWNKRFSLLGQLNNTAKLPLLPALNKLLKKAGQLTLALNWSDVSFLSTDSKRWCWSSYTVLKCQGWKISLPGVNKLKH